jgi:hypothetical protein
MLLDPLGLPTAAPPFVASISTMPTESLSLPQITTSTSPLPPPQPSSPPLPSYTSADNSAAPSTVLPSMDSNSAADALPLSLAQTSTVVGITLARATMVASTMFIDSPELWVAPVSQEFSSRADGISAADPLPLSLVWTTFTVVDITLSRTKAVTSTFQGLVSHRCFAYLLTL